MKRCVCLFLTAALLLFPITLHADGSDPPIRAGSADTPRIALTFDDGPHPKKTDAILDLLEEYGIRATFFVIGENVGYYTAPLMRAVSLGHEIGNHTFSHGRTAKLTATDLETEIRKTEDALASVGVHTNLFRPPEGVCSETIMQTAKKLGYRVVLWNVDTRDWDKASVEEIVKRVRTGIRGGSIILFHDYTAPGTNTLAALRCLIPELLADGYEFVTVSELCPPESPA